MTVKACKKGQMLIKGRCTKVITIPKKELEKKIADAKKDLKDYDYPEDMSDAHPYGYREGTIDSLTWVKNYKILRK